MILDEQSTFSLQQAFQEWQDQQDDDAFDDLLHAYREFIGDMLEGQWTNQRRELLLEILPIIFRYVVEDGWDQSRTTEIQLMAMLGKDALYESVLTLPKGATYLAILGVSMATYYARIQMSDSKEIVHQLLVQWLEKGLPDPKNPTPGAVIDAVYGNSIYALCFDEQTTLEETVQALWRLKFPDKDAGTSIVTLPSDFS